jgi:putative permease
MQLITEWFRRTFSDPQVVVLVVVLAVLFAIVLFMGDMLAPALASIVIAYLLDGLVAFLQKFKLPRMPAVLLVFIGFLALVVIVVFGLMPLLSRQVTELVQQLPSMISNGQNALMQLPQTYPDLVSEAQIEDLVAMVRNEFAKMGQVLLSLSLSSVVGFITILIYLILVPLLVFFFLKDKQLILGWLLQFLPKDSRVTSDVWHDVDSQIANYVRGKSWEIIIVGSVSYLTFSIFGLDYALLLAVLVGLSVVVPYVGAAVVTVPVLLIAWFQWGWSTDFMWLTVAYLVIQALDGNVLVPLLFSEVVSLHPVAIIVAILVFGGLWGFWGVFFAIPLATLVKAVLSVWPRKMATSEADHNPDESVKEMM